MVAPLKNSEIEKFNALADDWWNPHGSMAPLHWMNPARLQFIKQHLPAGKLIGLDLGCGAGLLTEPLTRMGHCMTGMDGAADALNVARMRAETEGLKIDYRLGEVPHAAIKPDSFDFITALEIIEHVDNQPGFVQAALQCLKPGGLLFMSTLNRTLKSRLIGIVGAEYVLRVLPVGTHDYKKFVKPSELVTMLDDAGAKTIATSGLAFNPLKKSFTLSAYDLDINYILVCQKRR